MDSAPGDCSADSRGGRLRSATQKRTKAQARKSQTDLGDSRAGRESAKGRCAHRETQHRRGLESHPLAHARRSDVLSLSPWPCRRWPVEARDEIILGRDRFAYSRGLLPALLFLRLVPLATMPC